MTWKNIYDYILATYSEGRELPEPQVVLDVCNAAIRQMPGPPYTWKNTTALENVLYVPVPSSIAHIRNINLFGETLRKSSIAAYNTTNPDWREETDDEPCSYALHAGAIWFGAVVPSIAVAALKIHGDGYIPPISLDPAAPNPFDYIQEEFWMLPAYYAAANLPRSSGRALNRLPQDELLTLERNSRAWESGLERMRFARAGEAYTF